MTLIRLQWGHGKKAVESKPDELVTFTKLALQWGHGKKAVESSVEQIDARLEQIASMGPRQESRGIRSSSSSSPTSFSPLQWGHGKKAVESGMGMVNGYRSGVRLQWGHGKKAVESCA